MKNPSNRMAPPPVNPQLTTLLVGLTSGTRKYADEPAPVHAPMPEITIDYPRIASQPEYAAEMQKLNRFVAQRDQAIKTHEALQAEIEKGSKAEGIAENDPLAKAERLLSGGVARDPRVERDTAAQLINALNDAIHAQHLVLREVDHKLSRAAGRRFTEEHKERVRRVMAAVVELHEANQAEVQLRTDLGRLGYNSETVPPMILHSVHNPFANSENITFYWYEEAKKYVQTDAEVAAGVRKARLAAAIGDAQ